MSHLHLHQVQVLRAGRSPGTARHRSCREHDGARRHESPATRQHNEPAGGQDVWHYHVHVTPRFEADQFYRDHKIAFPESERLAIAKELRDHLKEKRSSLF